MVEKSKDYSSLGVAMVLAPCSSRKTKLSPSELVCSSLRRSTQDVVQNEWLSRIAMKHPLTEARHLYAGDSFARVLGAADRAQASLFVISAGLGLVNSETHVPSYDLTLARHAEQSVRDRVEDMFVASNWWSAVQGAPYSSSIREIEEGSARILVALTRSYAELIGPALTSLPAEAKERLRIFGSGVEAHLPVELRRQVIPFDSRLDALVPGTKLNGASRHLAHFANLVSKEPVHSVERDRCIASESLSGIPVHKAASRRRVPDAVLRKRIEAFVRQGFSATNALRLLRKDLSLACEEQRFRKIYSEVRS